MNIAVSGPNENVCGISDFFFINVIPFLIIWILIVNHYFYSIVVRLAKMLLLILCPVILIVFADDNIIMLIETPIEKPG